MGGHCDQRMLIANLTSDFILATAYQTLVNSVELDAFNQVCSARHIDLTKIEQETEFRTMPEQDFVAGDKKKK
jgi:hypothetical protein